MTSPLPGFRTLHGRGLPPLGPSQPLPLAPYFSPGNETLARAVEALAGEHHAVLLANQGPVVVGPSLELLVVYWAFSRRRPSSS